MQTDTPVRCQSVAKPWLSRVRHLSRRTIDHEIYCFCSPTETAIEQDRFPYAPGWIDLTDMSLVQARKAADYLGVALVRGTYEDYTNTWDMNRAGTQVPVSNRLAEKLDTIN